MESELPKRPLIRYTDSRILIGNWNEEHFAKEEKFRKFLAKRVRGDLISQKSSQIFVNFLKDIQLEVRCDFIRFGACIQIMSPDMPKMNMNNQSLVVSIAIDGLSVDRIKKINSDCIVSLAPSDRPTVRNTFVITSPDNEDRTNEILKFNQDFSLKCVDADEMLCSAPKLNSTLNSSTYCPYKYLKNGEINQNVGLAVRKNDETAAVRPMHFRWRCLHIHPSIRFETEGQHVPSNCKLVICHSATNKLLAGEDVLFKGVFGMVCNVRNFICKPGRKYSSTLHRGKKILLSVLPKQHTQTAHYTLRYDNMTDRDYFQLTRHNHFIHIVRKRIQTVDHLKDLNQQKQGSALHMLHTHD